MGKSKADELDRVSYIVKVRVTPVRDGVWNQPKPDLERALMSYRSGNEWMLRRHIDPSRGGIQYATRALENMQRELLEAICKQEVKR